MDLPITVVILGDLDCVEADCLLAGDLVFGVVLFFCAAALDVFLPLVLAPVLVFDKSTTEGVVLPAEFCLGDFLLAGELLKSITDLAPDVFLFGVFFLVVLLLAGDLVGVCFFVDLLVVDCCGVFFSGGEIIVFLSGVDFFNVGLLIFMKASRVFF